MTGQKNIYDNIKNHFNNDPKKIALVVVNSEGISKHISYRQLHMDSLKIANTICSLHLKSNKFILLVFEHSYDLISAVLGAMYSGTMSSIYPYIKSKALSELYKIRLKQFVLNTKPGAIITMPEFHNHLEELLSDTGCKILCLNGISDDTHVSEITPVNNSNEQSNIYVQFSSGTTGLQKGVMLSHQAIMNNLMAMGDFWQYTRKDVCVSWLPLYHDMGLFAGLLLPLIMGARVVLISPFQWVRHPELLLWMIHEYKGTITWMPNFGFAHCVNKIQAIDIEGIDLSSWRILINAAEIVQYDTLINFKTRFAEYGFQPEALMIAYGMAETVCASTCTPLSKNLIFDLISTHDLQQQAKAIPVSPDTHGVKKCISCGIPVSGTEIFITDEKYQLLSERHLGEVTIRSNSMFSGYYRRPDLTINAFHHGFFHTGDIGYIADGQLFICDRKNDLIIVRGQNIYPHDIESVAVKVMGDNIRYCAAFGIKKKSSGTEIPVLVCEIKNNKDQTNINLYKFQIRQIVFQELDITLGDIRFVSKGWIVKTSSGKISRSANGKKYVENGFDIDMNVMHLPELEKNMMGSTDNLTRYLVEIFETFLGISPIDPKENFLEMGLDSLLYIRLFSTIEQCLGKRLLMDKVYRYPTINDLANMLMNRFQDNPDDQCDIVDPFRHMHSVLHNKSLTPADKVLWFIQHPLKAAIQNGPTFGNYILPYAIGSKFLYWFCNQKWAQSIYFRKRISQIKQFLLSTDQSVNVSETIRLNLTGNFWKYWRWSALASCNHKQFKRWVNVRGGSKFQNALQQGRGVILLGNHVFLFPIIFNFLQRLGLIEKSMFIGGSPYLLELLDMSHMKKKLIMFSSSQSRALLISQFYASKQILEQGGTMIILPVGLIEQPGIQMPFFDRSCYMGKSFADLGITMNAEMIPVWISMDISGHIQIDFLSPLEKGDSHLAYNEHLEFLTKQYRDITKSLWIKDLGNISWDAIDAFLQQDQHP
ncbi:MAG: AMP-binding protein [Candidatus Magnetomorum sp.]|nr:AMP-binding protein [Candidatus Magnetomorum sp.]